MEINQWYFDAWAVRDGLAFVSQRPADSIASAATVFLTVPDLEAVPVGRISTALRANRANFQDGFRDANGDEFAFANLDQIREVIRRAYLAGGLGPVPTGEMRPPENPFLQVTVPVPPGPKTPDESGGNYYDRKVTEFHKDPNIWLNYSDLQYPDKRSALLLAVHNRAAASDLHAFIRVFAEATLIECARRFGPYLYRAENRDLVQSWASVLWSMDLWDRTQDFEEILKYCGLGSLAHFLSPGPWFRKQLLFSIPCPLRPEWDPRIRFLSDKLLLALTIRDYFKYNDKLPELIPSLFCSMVLVASPAVYPPLHPEQLRYERQRLSGQALNWLNRELPKVDLPDQVELELTQYALGQLDRR